MGGRLFFACKRIGHKTRNRKKCPIYANRTTTSGTVSLLYIREDVNDFRTGFYAFNQEKVKRLERCDGLADYCRNCCRSFGDFVSELFGGKSALQLLLLSIHHALVGIGSLLLTYVIEGSDM
jgi:hypothetical protein